MTEIVDFIRDPKTKAALSDYLCNKGVPDSKISELGRKVPARLFRYCSLDEYTLSNLQNNEITLSSPLIFNDLYDCTIHRNSFPRVERDLLYINKQLSALGMKSVKMDMDYLKNDFAHRDRHYMTYMTEPMRIGCFSEDEKSILMWSHYADKNRGICIEYDFTGSPDSFLSLYPVIYLEKPLDVSDLPKNPSQGELETVVLLSSIIKSDVWAYEKEWRYIFYMITPNPLPERLQIRHAPVPQKIYLGSKFLSHWNENGKREILISFCQWIKRNNISLEVMYNEILKFELTSKAISGDLLEGLYE